MGESRILHIKKHIYHLIDLNLGLTKSLYHSCILCKCGNYGDAMTNPDLVPILKYIREINPKIVFTMNTNASGRDENFWTRW